MKSELLQKLAALNLISIGGNIGNKRVGNFLYIDTEANPRWLFFKDEKGNSVTHGGENDSTDVIIRINSKFRKDLESRLYDYLHELVGRHNEDLHKEGEKRFYAVTIGLPYAYRDTRNSDLEVKIHTGSGCCYDQDEIAHEVMSALSGFHAYKALAPRFYHRDFIRMDDIDDKKWVEYLLEDQGVRVKFSPLNDQTMVVALIDENSSVSNRDVFEKVMRGVFSEWLQAFTEDVFVYEPGLKQYSYEGHSLDYGQKTIDVVIGTGHPAVFEVLIPFYSHITFGRIVFAKSTMEALSEAFAVSEETETA